MTFMQPQLTYPAAASACALIASVTDVKSRRIPNLITVPAFFFGLLLHLFLGGWKQMLGSLAAGLICGVIFLIFYIAGGMGAGDVEAHHRGRRDRRSFAHRIHPGVDPRSPAA